MENVLFKIELPFGVKTIDKITVCGHDLDFGGVLPVVIKADEELAIRWTQDGVSVLFRRD
jgi:hypothetical protein